MVESLGVKRCDPLLRDIDLPFTGSYYPVGFRVDISTNSRDVLEAAQESWRYDKPEFKCQPLEFRVVIQPQGELAPEPAFRMQKHLFSIVSDGNNFAIGDPQAWFAAFFLSEKTAADHGWLRWYYLEAMACALLEQRYAVPIHAACVAHDGAGILLCGQSGAGKSTLSFACARAGFTFVSDDCTWLRADSEDRIAIGKPHQARFRDSAPSVFPELAGYVTSARPKGKLSLEVPLSDFPQIRTASRCPIRALVFLDRRKGAPPRAARMPPGQAAGQLLDGMATWGPEVNAMHERAAGRLQDLPAWRLHYESLDDALRLLSEVTEQL